MSESVTVLPATLTSPESLPTPVPTFAWSNLPAAFNTCTSTTVQWDYSGPPDTIQFILVPQVSTPTNAAIARKRATDNATIIVTRVDPTALTWTWPKVNASAGEYVLQASGTWISAASSSFAINNGADLSCLATIDNIRTSTTTPSASSTTISSEPSGSVTPMPTTSVRGAANIGVIAGGTIAGAVVLIVALVGYRVWDQRRRQRPFTGSHHPTGATHRDLPSLYFASTLAPPLTEKGTSGTGPFNNVTADSPPVPNRRPPSPLLSEPHTPVPPYTSHARTRERAAGSLMGVSTIGSRSSAALSDATSTTRLMQTLSSYSPPSYATSPSPPPSYATDAAYGPRTPRSSHLSYASSS